MIVNLLTWYFMLLGSVEETSRNLQVLLKSKAAQSKVLACPFPCRVHVFVSVVWCGVVGCCVVWCGVVCCAVMWCGVV